jgi:phage protein D
MADEHKGDFLLIANGANITETIKKSFLGLTLTDASGFESDTLEIALSADGVDKPPKGADLELWMGYERALIKMGLFVVDELQLGGWPSAMTIRARSTPFEASKSGLSDLQSQKTRSWARGTTLDSMVAKIAKEHKLKPLLSNALKGIVLPHENQTAESDISFLLRVGRRYDAIVKPSGGKIAVFKRGDFTLPTVSIDAVDAGNWNYSESSRENEGTVVAFWHHRAQAKRKLVQVGTGEPVKQLRQWYPTEAAAKAAAQAEHDRRHRGSATFSCSMPGNARLSADYGLEPRGFHPGVPSRFVITQVTHRLDSSRGYTCDVSSELPND